MLVVPKSLKPQPWHLWTQAALRRSGRSALSFLTVLEMTGNLLGAGAVASRRTERTRRL